MAMEESDGLRIAYISDLHLHHHLKYYDDNEERMIEEVVDKLLQSLERMNAGQYNRIYAIFFGGDVSETPELTIAFLKAFRTKVRIPIFFVLGNHDYIAFPDVASCVKFYRERLQEMQITLLHNEYVECSHLEERFIIFGGTGLPSMTMCGMRTVLSVARAFRVKMKLWKLRYLRQPISLHCGLQRARHLSVMSISLFCLNLS